MTTKEVLRITFTYTDMNKMFEICNKISFLLEKEGLEWSYGESTFLGGMSERELGFYGTSCKLQEIENIFQSYDITKYDFSEFEEEFEEE